MKNEEVREGTIEANGLRFAYLEAGDGPLVILLHGFPDNAWTWEGQIPALAQAGYRVVAPFLRGYPPTEIPKEPFDTENVTQDVIELIKSFGKESAYVVGHDWGALAALNAAALDPSSIKSAVAIGVGHPRTAIDIFKSPSQIHYSFHIWFFQLEGFAEFALRENDYALIDYLWNHWSSQPVDEDHLARVKQTLAHPGAIEAALAYYRGLVRVPKQKPEFLERVTQPLQVPTLVVFGSDDPAQKISEGEDSNYEGPFRRVIVKGAGHFVHREQPTELTRLLIDWIETGQGDPAREAVASST
jgi:pimeloyl-ACP methyl ester carboxylesterase